MKLKKISILLLTTVVLSASLYAQDAHFSQFYGNILYYNPAFAGTAYAPRLFLSYRNQWPVLGVSYVSYAAGFDHFFSSANLGMGLHVMNDQQGQGAINAIDASFMLAPHIKINRNLTMSAGFEMSYHQRWLDVSNLVYPDQSSVIDGGRYTESLSTDFNKYLLDFGAGILLFDSRNHLSVSVLHINAGGGMLTPKSANFFPFKYTASAGTKISLTTPHNQNQEFSVSPAVIFQMQGNNKQLNYGATFTRGMLIFGAWARQNIGIDFDAVIAMLGIKYFDLKLGYSYDFTISKMRKTLNGAHEISLVYKFSEKQHNQKKRRQSVSCPAF